MQSDVVDIGPVEWTMTALGRTASLVASMDSAADALSDPRSRRQYVLAMREVSVSRPAALVLLNAPSAVRTLVEHGPEQLPAGFDSRWLEPALAKHLQAVYKEDPFRWYPRNTYAATSPLRQAVCDLLADRDGSVTLDELRAAMPWIRSSPAAWFRTKTAEALRPWAVPYAEGAGSAGRTLSAIACSCGSLRRVIARVPEVPGDLLCECGRIPDAHRWGVDPELQFPPEYQRLRVPEDAMQRYVEESMEAARQRDERLTPKALEVLKSMPLLKPLRTAQIAQSLGTVPNRHLTDLLTRLVHHGLIRSLDVSPQQWEKLREVTTADV